ncbi:MULTISPECIES: thioredoxin family protein [Massilia]|uniref:Thioredoxin n=1 Tax=Massilia frigida TaxID=2609281 RepID=A0ABX0NEY0_9BURK|nr:MULTISPECIES: thioredoxin family protein [Massilia]MDQ1833207.1 thioredoxin family protein [Massilia sp. CCM 9029]NHZ80513.1 thioredoxin [Massilia frigida]
MSTGCLDPWSDAAEIADRLASPFARLVLMLGAEDWCETCRLFRPVFDSIAHQRAGRQETWLWLDLEEHGEFLGDYIPDSLPLLVVYKGAQLTHAVIAGRVNATELEELLAQPSRIEHSALPDLRGRLMSSDWAL